MNQALDPLPGDDSSRGAGAPELSYDIVIPTVGRSGLASLLGMLAAETTSEHNRQVIVVDDSQSGSVVGGRHSPLG